MLKKIEGNQEQAEKREILKQYRALLRNISAKINTEDKKSLRLAFDIALDAHKNMRRKSGEPYILHPIAVARIAAGEIGLGVTSIICALLHDVVEDSEWTLAEIDAKFGTNVSKIIGGLTKIDGVIVGKDSMQAENFRKLLLTMSEDVRVILIKLCDRLHNLRTLSSMSKKNQMKIASETIYLYAPLAHRLGLNTIKTELEDLSLKYTQPEQYHAISSGLQSKKAQRTKLITRFIEPLNEQLKSLGNIEYTIKGRPKSIYSIFKKMQKQGLDISQVYDLLAVRIVITNPNLTLSQEKLLCWQVYSTVTDIYYSNQQRYRDWITTPKSNGYESVHTTVMGPEGKWVEVQIRSARMDEIAERGYAAHWKYKNDKDNIKNQEDNGFDRWLSSIKEVLENPDPSTIVFLDEFKYNLESQEIYVFTPNGDLKRLQKGSTLLDFAYEVHTNIGNKCIGGKIGGKLLPLGHKLTNGDQVEVITSEKQKPREEWKNIVVTSRALNRIKSALKEEVRKVAEEGEAILTRKFRNEKIKSDKEKINILLKHFKRNTSLELFYDIAIGKIEKEALKLKAIFDHKNIASLSRHKRGVLTKRTQIQTLKESKEIILGEDDAFDYEFAKCCNPIPGDSIFGFITINEGVKIHRTSCPNSVTLMSNYGYRIIKADWRWKPHEGQKQFLAGIKLSGFDDVGIISKITDIISKQLQVNMKSITVESNKGTFEGKIALYIYDTKHLEELMKQLSTAGINMNVSRIEVKE